MPKLGRKLENIKEVLKTRPELSRFTPEEWQNTHDFLNHEGFSSLKFAEIISQNPKLMTTSQEKILSSINSWRSFQFGEKETIKLLERYPEFLEIQPSKQITTKIDTLMNFVGGGSHIFQLLINSPTVISQPIVSITEKIEYLQTVMKVPALEVYKSAVFSLDLFALKTRHIFLTRLGLYVVRKKPDDISSNPQLYHITDTSDKRFATKVCHVTLEEFETFQELYKRELDEEQDEMSDDENYEVNATERVDDGLAKW